MDSSDDNFIWTDASSNSEMALNIKLENESAEIGNCEFSQDNEKINKKHAKKRKYAENCADNLHEEHKIKSELESEVDMMKKKTKKIKSDVELEKEQNIDSYLDFRVKQEQESFSVQNEQKSKKKKHKKVNLTNGNESHLSTSETLEQQEGNDDDHTTNNTGSSLKHIDDYLEFRVKQEQVSFVELEEKHKKKKNKKKSVDASTSDLVQGNDTEEIEIKEEKVERKKKKKKSKDNKGKIEETLDETETLENYDSKDQVDVMSVDQGNENINISSKNQDETKHKSKTKVSKKDKSVHYSSDTEHQKQNKSISEMLKFEDEDSGADSSVLNKTDDHWPTQIKNFVKINKNLSHLSTNTGAGHFISDDDEVWIIKCPHNIDINHFKGINITLDSKCKMKINGQTYDGVLDDTIQRVAMVAFDNTKRKTVFRNVPIMGVTKFHKRLPKDHIPDQGMMIQGFNSFIPLPETKCRHPLFGADYKEAIKVPAAIAKQLKGSIQEPSIEWKQKKKKHKKEKFKTEKESTYEAEALEIEPQLCSTYKKKNKRKHSEDAESYYSKAKRIKQDPDPAEAWESEQAIKNNLFGFE